MTHLRIELNNIQENVSSAVIEKLYELASSGDLDNTSNLAGNLHTTATYLEYIDAITGEFPELTISSDNIYIMLTDPEVKRVMATLFGDGTNISVSNLTGVTTLPSLLFYTNSNISTFNELKNLRGITTIGSNCFAGSTILSITLDNITTVYSFAFHNCSLSGEISMPNLTTIERNAFSSNSVTKINFGGSITSTPLAVCDSSRSLTLVSGLSNLTQIGESSFRNTALTSCDIDFTKVTSTGSFAFENCSSLTITGDFLEMLTIGESAYYRVNFTNGTLTCPKLTSLGGFAFRYSTGLTTVDFSGSTFTTINNYTFDSCTNLSSINLPTGLTTIGESAFSGCSSLSSAITIQNTVTYIGNKAFYNCGNIPSITFQTGGSNDLTIDGSLWDGPFRRTYSVNKIIFPENLSSLAAGALNIDNNETKIFVFTSTTPPSVGGGGLAANALGVNQNGHTIYVPDSSVTAYQNALGSNLSGKIYPVSQMPT